MVSMSSECHTYTAFNESPESIQRESATVSRQQTVEYDSETKLESESEVEVKESTSRERRLLLTSAAKRGSLVTRGAQRRQGHSNARERQVDSLLSALECKAVGAGGVVVVEGRGRKSKGEKAEDKKKKESFPRVLFGFGGCLMGKVGPSFLKLSFGVSALRLREGCLEEGKGRRRGKRDGRLLCWRVKDAARGDEEDGGWQLCRTVENQLVISANSKRPVLSFAASCCKRTCILRQFLEVSLARETSCASPFGQPTSRSSVGGMHFETAPGRQSLRNPCQGVGQL
ncbi:hypothetical protein MGYG_05168 [Nannizzia gypsea CBS 118893]|uniref:Uncharacterized protein n=1 Tax=Arthroderma gypseum (strain ATCC MYA-4604 / CBS 118893) TaxID=535722 RepID=E4UYK2_ARTGP|nr:hypothetical protein MGYG_05168 [Nannizzia gypsea CBS 118893]EFR02165.1 hypothetical protein MGYG_05168 [Nannizzia gypsea CBS 118893]